jgi:hypothetical protein
VPLDAQEKACDLGDHRACVKVAEALYNGADDVAQDADLGAWMFRQACEGGEPTGCVNAGWAALKSGDPAPGEAAAPLFARACTGTVTIGCLGLGTIYRDGRDTAKDPARAAELFKKACDGGVKPACAMAKTTKPRDERRR